MNSNTKISLVAGTRKYDFVKQLLREQHCLPIACHRVQALFCAHQPSWIAKQTASSIAEICSAAVDRLFHCIINCKAPSAVFTSSCASCTLLSSSSIS